MTAHYLLLAAGRGDNPSEIGGILTVAGIALGVLLLGLAAHFLTHRFGRRRSDIFRRRPYRRGRIGRIR